MNLRRNALRDAHVKISCSRMYDVVNYGLEKGTTVYKNLVFFT